SRTCVAAADGCPPADFGAVFGEALEDAVLAPDAVALRAEPLRPIVRLCCRSTKDHAGENHTGRDPKVENAASLSFPWHGDEGQAKVSLLARLQDYSPV